MFVCFLVVNIFLVETEKIRKIINKYEYYFVLSNFCQCPGTKLINKKEDRSETEKEVEHRRKGKK